MATWPSGTKASTANVDSGTDLISQARPDIKQNIDNVNSIIDSFNVASPSDGDLLQYSSSNARWEPIARSAIQTHMAFATHEIGDNLYPTTAGTLDRYITWTEVSDSDNFFSVSNGTITLSGSGTFILNLGHLFVNDLGSGPRFYNESTSTLLYILTHDNTTDNVLPQSVVVTQASTTNYAFRIDDSNSTTSYDTVNTGGKTTLTVIRI